MAQGFKSLDAVSVAANGAAYILDSDVIVGAGGPESYSLQVDGMVTNDIVQVEASNDEGVTWMQMGADITADGIYSAEAGAGRYRANLSDDTGGGTVTAIFFGGY